jgi:hypothetical protein
LAAEGLDRERLEHALEALGREAWGAGKVIEIAIYGGSCLLLATDLRRATRDVDVAVTHEAEFLHAAARRVGERLGLPDDWLNDGVTTYLAPNDQAARRYFGSYPSEAEPGLRVFVPTPEYLLAMKLMAMRIDPASGARDLDDILYLISVADLRRKEDLIELAAGFYPEARVSGRLVIGLEGIWREKERRDRAGWPRPTWKPRRGS